MSEIRLPCPDIDAQIPLFVGGDLEPSVQASVEAHLAGCGACAIRAESARRARGLYLRSLELGEAAPDLWPGIRSRLAQDGLLAGTSPRAAAVLVGPPASRFGGLLASAAAVLVFGMLYLGLRAGRGAADPVVGPGPAVADAPAENVGGPVAQGTVEPTGGLVPVGLDEPILSEDIPLRIRVLPSAPGTNALATDRYR